MLNQDYAFPRNVKSSIPTFLSRYTKTTNLSLTTGLEYILLLIASPHFNTIHHNASSSKHLLQNPFNQNASFKITLLSRTRASHMIISFHFVYQCNHVCHAKNYFSMIKFMKYQPLTYWNTEFGYTIVKWHNINF